MGEESAIVVGDRKELTYLLCQAAELEHGLMCEYLYAAFSLKSTAGAGLRDDQLAAVERWREAIFAITAARPGSASPSASTNWPPSPPACTRPRERT